MVSWEGPYETLAEYPNGEYPPLRVRLTWRGRLGRWVRRRILRQSRRPIQITIHEVDPNTPMTTLGEEKGT